MPGRRAHLLTAVAALALVVSCGGEDEPTPGAEPVASPGTTPTATTDLDLCALVGPEPPAAFLSSLDAGPVDQEQGSSSDRAAVCGWFLSPVGDARPEGVVVRVESVLPDGNPACEPPPDSDVTDLGLDGAETSWITLADDRVDAAAITQEWCVYVRGPLGAATGPDVPTSTRQLFGAVLDALDEG